MRFVLRSTVRTDNGAGPTRMIRSNCQEGTAGRLWKRLIVLPLCVCLLTACSARKQVLPVSVSDTERLRDLLTHKRIDASFADGTQVGGRVREVQDGLLMVDVKESSGPSPRGTGLQSIPTDRISTVRFTQHTWYWRALFGPLFALGGLALGTLYVSFGEGRTKDDRAVEIGATAGAGVLGYFLGRQKDKQNVTVDVTAEDSTYRKSLYLKKGKRISGRISDSEGKPISRAQVSVYYARAAGSDPVPVMYQWESGDVISDGQGAFEIRNVHPEKELVVEASHEDFLPSISTPTTVGDKSGLFC